MAVIAVGTGAIGVGNATATRVRAVFAWFAFAQGLAAKRDAALGSSVAAALGIRAILTDRITAARAELFAVAEDSVAASTRLTGKDVGVHARTAAKTVLGVDIAGVGGAGVTVVAIDIEAARRTRARTAGHIRIGKGQSTLQQTSFTQARGLIVPPIHILGRSDGKLTGRCTNSSLVPQSLV
jgi:hypothetical protein